MTLTKTVHNLADNPIVALVIEDEPPHRQPHGMEIRGTAEAEPSGGSAVFGSPSSAATDDALIRITPTLISSLVWWRKQAGNGIAAVEQK